MFKKKMRAFFKNLNKKEMIYNMVPKNYWQIARRLSTSQLQKTHDNNSAINELDLFNINIGKRGHSFFLGYYSKEGLELVFEKYGVYELFKQKGFTDIQLHINTDDPFIHKLHVYNKERKPENMLVEVVLKREQLKIDMPFKTELNNKIYNALAIEWMGMQNPQATFTEKRPQLPGQKYPGLGLASKAVELLMIAAWRLNLAGLINNPEHFHNAYLYSRIFYYLSPEAQARIRAIERDLKKYPLNVISWAFEWGAIKDFNEDKILEWPVSRQIIPLNKELKQLFDSYSYKRAVKTEMKRFKFELDYQKYINIKNTKEKE